MPYPSKSALANAITVAFGSLLITLTCFSVAHASTVGPKTLLAQVPKAAPKVAPTPRGQTLSSDSSRMLEFLLAELAAQRGDGQTASNAMMDLARYYRDPELAKRALELAHRNGKQQEARSAAVLWAELEPEGSGAQVLADFLANEGSLEAASGVAQKLIAAASVAGVEPLGSKSLTGRAALLMQLNVLFARFPDKQKVRVEVDRIAALYPQVAQAAYSKSWAAYIAADYLSAHTAADEALKLDPTWDRAAMAKMAALKKQSADKKKVGVSASSSTVVAFAQDFLKRNPDSVELRQLFARELAGDRRYAESREQYKLIAQTRKDDPQVTVALAMLEQQLGAYAEAEALYRKALTYPTIEEDVIFQSLAQLAETRKDYPQAIEWLNRLAQGPNAGSAQRQLALLVSKSESAAAGLAALSKAPNEQRVDKVGNASVAAQIHRDAKQYVQAHDVLKTALADIGEDAELLYDYAMAAERIDKLDAMEKSLRRVMELKPDFAHTYNALGYSFVDRNIRLPEAKTLLEKAVSLAPEDAFIIDSLGWLYYRMGNLPDALVQLERAYQLRPDAEIAAHLSEVLHAQGKTEAANELLTKAMKTSPGNDVLQSVANKLKLKP